MRLHLEYVPYKTSIRILTICICEIPKQALLQTIKNSQVFIMPLCFPGKFGSNPPSIPEFSPMYLVHKKVSCQWDRQQKQCLPPL